MAERPDIYMTLWLRLFVDWMVSSSLKFLRILSTYELFLFDELIFIFLIRHFTIFNVTSPLTASLTNVLSVASIYGSCSLLTPIINASKSESLDWNMEGLKHLNTIFKILLRFSSYLSFNSFFVTRFTTFYSLNYIFNLLTGSSYPVTHSSFHLFLVMIRSSSLISSLVIRRLICYNISISLSRRLSTTSSERMSILTTTEVRSSK